MAADPQPQPTSSRCFRRITVLRKRFFSLGRGANGAQWVSAFCSVITAIAAIVAVFAFTHSLKAERIKAAEESIARLYPMDNEIERLYITTNFYDLHTRDLFRADEDGEKYHEFLKQAAKPND